MIGSNLTGECHRMKIVRIETVRLEAFPNLLFVEVTTDEGITGLGETFYGADAVEAHIHSVVAPLVLGQDSSRIEAINLLLQGYTGYSGTGAENRARSAVDIALWDILGQRAGLPLYALLGGRTTTNLRAYNTCAGAQYVRQNGQAVANWGLGGREPYEDLQAFLDDAGGLAESLLDSGISGMKIWPFDPFAEASRGTYLSSSDLKTALEPIVKIRRAVGDAMDVMIELHGLWNVPMARRLVMELAEYRPFWIEDPVRADAIDGLAEVAATAAAYGTMIAAGETVAGVTGFLPLLANRAIDVVTLDLGWTGGISEGSRIAKLAAAHGRAVAPHDCTGPIGLIAATHLSTAAANSIVQETVRAALYGWYGELVTDLPVIQHGLITPPEGAGLGTRLQPQLKGRPGVRVRTSRAESAAQLDIAARSA